MTSPFSVSFPLFHHLQFPVQIRSPHLSLAATSIHLNTLTQAIRYKSPILYSVYKWIIQRVISASHQLYQPKTFYLHAYVEEQSQKYTASASRLLCSVKYYHRICVILRDPHPRVIDGATKCPICLTEYKIIYTPSLWRLIEKTAKKISQGTGVMMISAVFTLISYHYLTITR